jgi:hypothetical protein
MVMRSLFWVCRLSLVALVVLAALAGCDSRRSISSTAQLGLYGGDMYGGGGPDG